MVDKCNKMHEEFLVREASTKIIIIVGTVRTH